MNSIINTHSNGTAHGAYHKKDGNYREEDGGHGEEDGGVGGCSGRKSTSASSTGRGPMGSVHHSGRAGGARQESGSTRQKEPNGKELVIIMCQDLYIA